MLQTGLILPRFYSEGQRVYSRVNPIQMIWDLSVFFALLTCMISPQSPNHRFKSSRAIAAGLWIPLEEMLFALLWSPISPCSIPVSGHHLLTLHLSLPWSRDTIMTSDMPLAKKQQEFALPSHYLTVSVETNCHMKMQIKKPQWICGQETVRL